MKNSMIFRRLGAYLIDFLVIMLINSAIAYIGFINPKYEEYKKYSEEYSSLLNNYYEKEIDITEFNDKVSGMAYDLNYNGYVYILGDIVVAFLYFGVFQYITKGQTLGKKLLNIKVISNSDRQLKLHNYFIRTFILNGVILNIITFIAVWLGRDNYYKVYSLATNVDYLLMVMIFLTIMLTRDGRGLHDILAGTKVVDARETLAVKEDKKVVDALEAKEVKEVEEDKPKEIKEIKKEEVKPRTKKSTTEVKTKQSGTRKTTNTISKQATKTNSSKSDTKSKTSTSNKTKK